MANPNHRVVVNPGSLPFAGYPIKLITTTDFNVDYNIEIGDRAYGNTGYRIWDTAILPLSGSRIVSSNTPLIFPFTTAFLPPCYFDSVSILSINGQRYIQAFSNSPDNAAGYNSSYYLEEKIVYAINIYNINYFSPPANRHYTFGGSTQRNNGGDDSLFIYFDKPTRTSITMSIYVQYYSSSTGLYLVPPRTYTFIIPANTFVFNTGSYMENNVAAIMGQYQFSTIDGVYKIQVTTTDSLYVSALPFYHWGNNN